MNSCMAYANAVLLTIFSRPIGVDNRGILKFLTEFTCCLTTTVRVMQRFVFRRNNADCHATGTVPPRVHEAMVADVSWTRTLLPREKDVK
jgi:hypothetical protein